MVDKKVLVNNILEIYDEHLEVVIENDELRRKLAESQALVERLEKEKNINLSAVTELDIYARGKVLEEIKYDYKFKTLDEMAYNSNLTFDEYLSKINREYFYEDNLLSRESMKTIIDYFKPNLYRMYIKAKKLKLEEEENKNEN